MNLTPEVVETYKECLSNPQKYGLSFKPLSEYFEECSIVTPKHILFETFINHIQKPIPKVIFYIIMDELYSHTIGIDEETGNIGYKLKFK